MTSLYYFLPRPWAKGWCSARTRSCSQCKLQGQASS